jgi:hypothetical protein
LKKSHTSFHISLSGSAAANLALAHDNELP